MPSREPNLGIVYEHPQWFIPLFAQLEERGVRFDRADVSSHFFDPQVGESRWTVVLNRMSPSASLRGHGRAIAYTRELLRHLEAAGVDVINGSRAFALETSKVAQLRLLRSLGLRAPRARVINDPAQAAAAAEALAFPVVVKPNIGGSGAGIQRFETPAALREAVRAGAIDLGVEGVALVQEFLPPRDGHIVRVEVLDGQYLYAIAVYPDPNAGFNLCPADICRPDDPRAQRGAPPTPPLPAADLCPVDLPRTALRIEAVTPPRRVIEDVLAIARAGGLDLAGVEYLVNDRDGEIYYYDVNALSNFVTDAVRIVGFDPYAVLADYLVRRGRLAERIPAAGL
ncbi:MAG TPA: hypothetical protein VNN19_07360 [bacterium]|nr:hypothetical protein [bacterium]